MNWKTTGIIISREYLNKVKKKSFIWTTLLVPILVAGLTIGIMVAMMNTKEKTKTIAVVDESGIVLPYLTDSETIHYQPLQGVALDSIKTNLASYGFDGVLSVGQLDTLEKTVPADLYSPKPFGMELVDNINARINRAVEDYRIASYHIEGLDQILKDVKANVRLRSYTVSDSGEEKISEAGVYSILSMILGIFLFMFITLFGGMVMSSVIEEKASRVVEVLVSSVKATELMFGKIIGIALVALTQFLLWIVLSVAIISIGGAVIGFDKLAGGDATEMVSSMGGVDAEQLEAVTAQVSEESGLSTVVSTLTNIPWGQLIGLFLVYFVFGYLLYASMFAAIGSAVENEGDTQQLQLPLTIPLMLAYIIALYAFRAPDSSIAFWGSIIPFTSPIVMISRLPFGVPAWEIILSIVLLVLTFVLFAWASAKIYKVGILMFGKKSTWKDLWKWFKQK
ncbi:MAG: ABC transporter permease [Bacteroidales bacterium]|nr:ABC transporter permease [Bacteroidales bacterium]MBR4524275.1 ABC transporter permease [Bacteroidales bacterium]